MRDICNSGWDVTVLIQSASGFNSSHTKFWELQDRLFCVRTGQRIPLVIQQFPKIGFGLNSKHRAYMRGRLSDFDYFCFAEEDMLLTASHLAAYVAAYGELQSQLGSELALRYCIGFIRCGDWTTRRYVS